MTSFLFFRETKRTRIGLAFLFLSPVRCTTETSAGVMSAPTALKTPSTFCSVSSPPPPSAQPLWSSLYGSIVPVCHSRNASEAGFSVGFEPLDSGPHYVSRLWHLLQKTLHHLSDGYSNGGYYGRYHLLHKAFVLITSLPTCLRKGFINSGQSVGVDRSDVNVKISTWLIQFVVNRHARNRLHIFFFPFPFSFLFSFFLFPPK